MLKIQEKILHCNSHFVQSSLPPKKKSDISFAEIRSIVNYNTKADQIRSQISLYLFCAHNWGQHSTMDKELNKQVAIPSRNRSTWGVSLTPLGIQLTYYTRQAQPHVVIYCIWKYVLDILYMHRTSKAYCNYCSLKFALNLRNATRLKIGANSMS